jgi:metal-responsive CopG/Arc/MetJ family transcriptional regulator
VKTAVSIPDDVFEAGDRAAKALGISRSELYARAVAEYVEQLRRTDVTRRLNEVYQQDPASVDGALAKAQDASLGEPW